MSVMRAIANAVRLAAVIIVFAGGAAAAQSLKALRAEAAEEQALEREAAFTDSVCGTDLDAQIDWRSAADWPDGVSLAAACDGALGAVEAVCRNDASRVQRISRFVCAGDGAGPSLSGSTLRYGASPNGNGFVEMRDFLESRL